MAMAMMRQSLPRVLTARSARSEARHMCCHCTGRHLMQTPQRWEPVHDKRLGLCVIVLMLDSLHLKKTHKHSKDWGLEHWDFKRIAWGNPQPAMTAFRLSAYPLINFVHQNVDVLATARGLPKGNPFVSSSAPPDTRTPHEGTHGRTSCHIQCGSFQG